MKRYRRAFTWLCIAGLAMVAAGLVREMRTVRQDDDLFGRLVAITNEPEDKVRSNRILPGDIPVLLRWLRADSSASTKLRKLLNWVFERNSSETLEGEILSNPANWAVLGFEALGERGAKAADELGMLARTEKGKGAAREALLFIGEPAWDEVIELVGSPEFENRLFVARYLGIVGRRPKESQKILVKLAEDPEAEVRKLLCEHWLSFLGVSRRKLSSRCSRI